MGTMSRHWGNGYMWNKKDTEPDRLASPKKQIQK